MVAFNSHPDSEPSRLAKLYDRLVELLSRRPGRIEAFERHCDELEIYCDERERDEQARHKRASADRR